MKYESDFKKFQHEYWKLRKKGKTWEEAFEILTEKYGKKDGEDDDENNIYE